ncbi:hypothetical protein HDV00_008509 [Rhizophlyctis rosea]|nr:hypothetical protein HDV00_008509 [Rhizophlyctis rosea]
MSQVKIAAIEKEIDLQRSTGQWGTVKELAAKYKRKYASITGTGLDAVASADATLNQFTDSRLDNTPYDAAPEIDSFSVFYKDAGPTKELQSSLEPFAQRGGNGAGWGLSQQAQILLARVDLLFGNSEDAVQRIGKLQIPQISAVPGDCGICGQIAVVMAWAVKGLALARLKQDEEAIAALDESITAIENYQPTAVTPPSVTSPAQTVRPDSDQWLRWVEEALFAHAMLSTRRRNADAAQRSLRLYVKHILHTPQSSFSKRKAAILHAYFTALLGSAPNPLSSVPAHIISYHLPQHVQTELRAFIPMYEKLVTGLLTFPRGEDVTSVEEGRYKRVQEAYDWWVMAETCPQPDEAVGDQVERHYRLIEEVESIVETYLFFFEKHLSTKIELERKRRKEEVLIKTGSLTRLERTSQSRDSVESQRSRNSVHEAELRAPSPSSMSFKEAAKLALAVRRASDSADLTPIPHVDGETIEDAIGVLVAGVRIALIVIEGEETKLRTALQYAERAVELVRVHASVMPNAVRLSRKAFQYVGIACGELGLEVRDSQERQSLHSKALESLAQSHRLDEDAWDVLYQLGLTYAELGEIPEAILTVNKSLQLNSAHVPSWNLLALLMTARKEMDQALRVCDVGWKECVGVLVGGANAGQNGVNGDGGEVGGGFTWDAVGVVEKEELMNLKLTQLAIEATRFGPKAALESLQSLFGLFRKLFGTVSIADEGGSGSKRADGEGGGGGGGRQTQTTVDRINGIIDPRNLPGPAIRRLKGSQTGSATSSLPASPSAATLPALYRFRTYDLLITLWLAASSLYRELEQFEEAKVAVEEAEKLAEGLCRMDVGVKSAPGRLFRDHNVAAALQERNRRRGKLAGVGKVGGLGGGVGGGKGTVGGGGEAGVVAKWGPVDMGVRRVLADIAFESAMIRDGIYRRQMRPAPADRFMKYLSPAARIEAEHRARRRRKAAFPTSPSNASIASTTTFLTTTTAPVAYPRGITPPPFAIERGPSPASTAGAGSITNVNASVNTTPSPTTPFTPPLDPSSTTSQQLPITLPHLITTFFNITLLDDDHLPTRVHLGKLYHEAGDTALAEHWLERACKGSKGRGSGGGKGGVGSCYGGVTSGWGWEGWRELGGVLKGTGRGGAARDCVFFAVGLERGSFVRGVECLRRVV